MSAKKKPIPKRASASTAPEGKTSRLTAFFDRRFYPLAFGVLAIALMFRIGLLIEFPDFPYSESHKGTDLDMHFFNLWADRIVDGDILTDTILHPYHTWHDAVARASGAQDETEGRQLWSKWYGGKIYHQEPLYAWFVALVKSIFGTSLLPVYIVQMLLGLLSLWLIMLLGRYYAGAMAGIAGGLLFAFYSPGILFDFVLLRTSLQVTLLLAIVWTGEQLLLGKKRAWLMGFVGGAGYLLASTFMLVWLPLVIRWLYVRRQDIRVVWQTVIVFGFFVGLLVYRNAQVGVPLMASSSVGPVTYALSNFPDYSNELGFAYYPEVGALLDKVDGKMLPTIVESFKQFDSPWAWTVYQLHKLGAVFHWYEIPNNVNSYLARAFSSSLTAAFVPFSLIAGFGLWGWLISFREKKTLNLTIALLSQVAVMAGFYVLCRFRIPFAAAMAVFAGIAVQAAVQAWSTSIARSLAYSVMPVALWAFVARPWPAVPATYAGGDYGLITQTYFLPRLEAAIQAQDIKSCIRIFERILDTRPPAMRELPPGYRLDTKKERELATYYGKVCQDLGGLYRDAGDPGKADQYIRLAKVYRDAGMN